MNFTAFKCAVGLGTAASQRIRNVHSTNISGWGADSVQRLLKKV